MQANTTIEPQLRALSIESVQGIARRALSNNIANLIEWHYHIIDVNTGPVTGGLYRVVGTALVGGNREEWSTVLKVVTAPGPDTPPAYADMGHEIYWKREVLAYQSGFLIDLPGGLEAARCLSAEEQPDGSFWLWLEDLKDDYGEIWSLDQFAFAARTLGKFNGAYLTTRPLPEYSWLVRSGSPRGILDHSTWIRDVVQDPHTWEHPLLKSAFPTPIAERLVHLWADRHLLLNVFERLPQTLCHMDAWRGNLFAPVGSDGKQRLVAIDWAFVGKSTVGTDAGDLFGPSFGLFRVESIDPPTLDAVVFENYLDGLREVGWQGDHRVLRFAFTVLPSVKYACFIPWVADIADESKHSTWMRLSRRTMSEFLHNQATLIYYYLDLADEARALLDCGSIFV